jgi:hypothetical protein
MRKNKILIIVVIVLAVAAIILIFQNRRNTLQNKWVEFAINDTSSVTKIYMADMQGNEVLLQKESPSHWRLNDSMTARQDGVEMLLGTMLRLAVKAPVPRSSYNNVIKRLASTSVKVEIYQLKYRVNLFKSIKWFPHEKLVRTFYVGSATPDNQGSFMLKEGSDTPFVVYLPGFRGYISARFTAYVSDWRDHTIFAKRPSEISQITLEFPQEPDQAYKLEKPNANEVILTPAGSNEPLNSFDTTRIIEFFNAFRNIRFEVSFEEITAAYHDSILQQTPLHIITLTDTAGVSRTVATYRRGNLALQEDFDGNLLPYDLDRLYALLPEGNELVIVQYFVFDPITRPLKWFRRE